MFSSCCKRLEPCPRYSSARFSSRAMAPTYMGGSVGWVCRWCPTGHHAQRQIPPGPLGPTRSPTSSRSRGPGSSAGCTADGRGGSFEIAAEDYYHYILLGGYRAGLRSGSHRADIGWQFIYTKFTIRAWRGLMRGQIRSDRELQRLSKRRDKAILMRVNDFPAFPSVLIGSPSVQISSHRCSIGSHLFSSILIGSHLCS